ncbi:hypothetical protein K0U07_02110 [bacterium]|nr:hypothetical protein [bacterium]
MFKKILLLVIPFYPLFSSLCEPVEEGILCPSAMETPYNLRVSIGLLMQQIHIPNTDVCKKVIITTRDDLQNVNAPLSAIYDNNFQYTNFHLDPGLKATIGYLSNHDDFECIANFEWLHSRGVLEEEIFANMFVPSYIGEIFYRPGLSTFPIGFQKVDSFLDIRYFLLDLVVNKGSYFSTQYSFEPYAGIKASWIEYNSSQNFSKDLYDTTYSLPSGTSWQRNALIHFWGVGPSVGANANYYLFAGWSISSTLDLALLFGERSFRTSNLYLNSTTSDTQNIFVGRATNSAFSPTIRSLLGLQYVEPILNDTQFLTFKICFDGRVYFNQYPTIVNAYDSAFVADDIVYPSYRPSIVANNPFAMLGLVAEVLWSF